MYRGTYCARTGPLPLLPSGPGGVGGIASRRTRHMRNHTIFSGAKLEPEGTHMATALAHIPVEVYLHNSSYEPDAEFVDGQIEERPVGEYDHASWQEAIILWFREHAQEWNVRVKPELRVQVAPTRFRVPDVTVLDRSQPVEQIITHPPIAVFEVLSPEDTMTRMMRKLNDYAAMGIQHVWVIDPASKTYYQFVDGRLNPSTTFGQPDSAMHFSLSELEKLLD